MRSPFSSALRVQRRSPLSAFGMVRGLLVVFTLAALVLPLLTPTLGQVASADTSAADGADELYELKVTTDGSRKKGALLEEAGVVSGNVYVYLTPKKAAKKGVERSRFYLDPPAEAYEDSEMLGEPFSTDIKAPFDLAPGTGNKANAFDTTTLANGTHTIVGVLDLKSGVTIMVASTFEVYNGAPALVFDTPELEFDVQQGAEAGQTLYADLYTSNGVSQNVVFTGMPAWLKVDNAEFLPDGSVKVAPQSFSFVADPAGMAPGTYTATVTAQPQSNGTPAGVTTESGDGAGTEESVSPEAAAAPMQSDTLNITMEVAEAECTPLPCNQIKVQLPYVLDFDTNHGKIADRNGVGTGFTHLDQPSNSTGHIPANTFVNFAGTGTFDLTTTRGLMHLANNNQDNALGVGIDIPSQVTIIDTVISRPSAGAGNYEQAGLWFGNNEDNYIKLNVVSKPQGLKVEFIMEVAGQVVGSKVTDAMSFSNTDVRLVLRVDPGDRTVKGFFAVGEAQSVSIGSFSPPEEFFSFDAAGIDPRIGTRSFAGPYASHRLASAPLTYQFDSFSVTEEDDGGTDPGAWNWNRSSFPVSLPTAMAWGPDNRLYVAEMFGTIRAFTLNGAKQVVGEQVINTIGSRLTLGLTIDPASTPSNVILWVSHSNPSTSAGEVNSGTITKLSGSDFATRQDVITGLPRAWANHAPNNLKFGPDGKLYIAIGGNTGAGSANTAATEFGTRAEQPLSAALVVADVKAANFDGTCAQPEGAFYPAPCSVTIYSSGLRNMYDFVHHSNGHIYGPDNGLGVTGSYPPSPTPPCTGFGSTTSWQQGGNNPGSQPDKLQLLESGKYYGHPNPYRNECVFFSGSYQGVAPLPNYVPAMHVIGDHRSANGTIEYTSDAFAGSLKGAIIIANYSYGDNIVAYFPSADGRSITTIKQVAGGLANPLPITQAPDGTIFVGELGTNQVTALIPAGSGPGDVAPPAAPTGLTDGSDASGVLLDWADNSDADLSGYNVYRATNAAGPFTRVNTVLVTGSTYTDTAAPEGLPIFYRVTAIDTAGNESGPSNVVDAIRASSSSYSIQVSTNSNRSGAVNLAGATVFDNIYAFVAPTSGVSQVRFWIDNPDMIGTPARYEYSVPFDLVGGNSAAAQPYNSAQLADGQHILTALLMKTSGPSEVLHATFTVNNAAPPDTTPPAAPTAFTATGNTSGIALDWADNTESDLAGYNVYRATAASGPWTKLNTTLVTASAYADGTVAEGQTFFYQVKAVDTAGNESAASSTQSASRLSAPDTTPPAAPTGLGATPSATGIALDWANNTESDLKGYNVYRAAAAGGPWTKLTANPVTTSDYNDTAAPAGTASHYQVKAVDNANNESAASATVNATRPIAYSMVYSLTNTRTNPVALDGATVSGNIYPFSTPDLAGIARVKFYLDNTAMTGTPYRSEPGKPYDFAGGSSSKANPWNTATVADGQHTITARIEFTAGGFEAVTATFTVQNGTPSDTTPPAAPTGVVPTASATGIALDWADNTEGDLAGYYVYRSTSAGGSYTRLTVPMTTVSTFTDATAPVGQPSYYRITALDTSGNESTAATVNATRPPATSTVALPGTFQAEDYRAGGPNVGYVDTTAGNTGGKYRSDDVDIQSTGDSATPGGYHVSHIMPGEWLAYDVTVAESGFYRFTFRVATPNSNRTLRVELNGVNITGSVVLPNTGSYTTWGEVQTEPIDIAAGSYTLKLVFTGQSYNVNQVTVTKEAAQTSAWSTGADAPAAILDAGSAVINDVLYMVGGKTSASTRVRTLYAYTAATNSWATLPSMPGTYPAVENPAVVAHNGKLYVFGGSTSAFTNAVTHASVYDPATQAWSVLTPAPNARAGATAQVVNGLVYVVGGLDAAGNSLDTMDIYNPATNSWTAGQPMATRRDNPGSGVINGKLYVVGGRTRNADGTTVVNTLNTAEVYDPATNSWAPIANMPTGRRTMAVGVINGKLLVMGGESGPNSTAFPQNEQYDPATNSWTTLEPMPTGRHGMAYGVIGAKLYAVAGGPQAGATFTAIMEIFTPTP